MSRVRARTTGVSGTGGRPPPLKPASQEDGSGIFSRIISLRALPPGTMG
jgi:hypothetical protein